MSGECWTYLVGDGRVGGGREEELPDGLAAGVVRRQRRDQRAARGGERQHLGGGEAMRVARPGDASSSPQERVALPHPLLLGLFHGGFAGFLSVAGCLPACPCVQYKDSSLAERGQRASREVVDKQAAGCGGADV